MKGKFKGLLALALIAVVIAAVNLILSNLRLRVDLTAERLYTLSEGSRKVLGQLHEDVTLKYYISTSSDEMPMALKTYATQVGNLLREYEIAGGGRITLEQYDPKPDSEEEEWAQRYGIESQTVNPFGSGVYFGLVAVCGGREETLARLSPRGEATLEYDVTRLVTRVAWPERPVIGLMTALPNVLGGGMDQMAMMQGRRPTPGWAAFTELAKDYEVREIQATAESIPEDVKTLVVLHPKAFSEKSLFAIDQFVIRGGRLIACVDPFSVQDLISSRQGGNPMMQQGPTDGPSTLGKLFDAWGVAFEQGKVTADLAASTKLNAGNGRAEDNPAFLSLDRKNFAGKDVVLTGLTQVMMPFAGSFAITAKEGLVSENLIVTGDKSSAVDRQTVQYGTQAMSNSLTPDGKVRVLAARLSGTFKTAFPKGPDYVEGSTNAVPKVVAEGKGAVVLFADSDFLADSFCVQVEDTLFGRIARPMNDNLALFSNVIEQYAGREELIGVRSRGPANRPFVKVDRLEAEARAKWQKEQVKLEKALQETQQRLMQLQREKGKDQRMILSREQQDEISSFRKKQVDTKRQLKDLRKELTRDIDVLGMRLKALNIALVPFLVIAFGIFHGVRRRRRAK